MLNNHSNDRLAIIDFETLDTCSSTQILSIGATWFNPTEISGWTTLMEQTFTKNVKEQTNRTFSRDTIKWWMQQDKEVQNIAFSNTYAVSTSTMLAEFHQWLLDNKISYLVGNGVGFDNAIYQSLCEDNNIKTILPFWADIDMRTMKWLYNIKPEWPEHLTPHIAYHDSIYEARQFQEIYSKLKENTL